jgi:hypothetical protein
VLPTLADALGDPRQVRLSVDALTGRELGPDAVPLRQCANASGGDPEALRDLCGGKDHP